MPFVRMMRMLSAMESGQLSGVALEALLQAPGHFGELQVLVADRALFKRLQASSATMAAVLGSTTATKMVLDAAPDSLLDRHASLMMASGIALQKIIAETRWKTAAFKSAAALSALIASSDAMSAFRTAPGAFTARDYHNNLNNPLQITGTVANALYLLLGASTTSETDFNVTVAPRQGGSAASFVIAKSTGNDGTSGAGSMAIALGGGVSAPTCMRTSAISEYSSLRLLRCDI